MARKTNAQLTAELVEAKQALADLKTNVIKTARSYADEHGWCEVVDSALLEMGLNPYPMVRATYTVEITVEGTYLGYTAEPDPDALAIYNFDDSSDLIDEDYWADGTTATPNITVSEFEIIHPAG